MKVREIPTWFAMYFHCMIEVYLFLLYVLPLNLNYRVVRRYTIGNLADQWIIIGKRFMKQSEHIRSNN